jgi:hypothetical protein
MAGSKRRPKVQGAREVEGARVNPPNYEDDSMESHSTSPEESEAISAAGKAPSHKSLEIYRYSPTE